MALTRQDVEEIVKGATEPLEEKIKNLPTRDEFFTTMSEVMGELKTIREEITVLSDRQSIHSDQIEALESIHPGGKHTPTL